MLFFREGRGSRREKGIGQTHSRRCTLPQSQAIEEIDFKIVEIIDFEVGVKEIDCTDSGD